MSESENLELVQRVTEFRSKIKDFQSRFKGDGTLQAVEVDKLTAQEMIYWDESRRLFTEMKQTLEIPDFDELKNQIRILHAKTTGLIERNQNIDRLFGEWMNNRIGFIKINSEHILRESDRDTADIKGIQEDLEDELQKFQQ